MNDIYIFNTATSKKEKFVPIDEKNVRMYVCGPTVYDDIHIGNARPLIVFDVMYRLLNLKYAGHVKYVRNITDIDDKIINRAREKNITPEQLTTQTIADFHAITTALDCGVDIEPRATQHIDDMKTMIAQLVAKDFAYTAQGHVLFDVSKMADYGKFAKRPLDDLIAGARVEVAPYKKSPLDFVLWKPAKDGEPSYESPWGTGRPGWHIECSAMAEKELGGHFDIHGGGQDLIFPHHQNELAQSTGCGHAFANYWMHNGFILINGKKMSKSEGNFITVKDLLEKKKIPPAVLRLLMLSTHYRQPLDFTEAKLQEMMNVANKIGNAFRMRTFKEVISQEDEEEVDSKIIGLLGNDLNTIDVIEEMHQAIKAFNKDKNDKSISFLSKINNIFGVAGQYYAPIVNLTGGKHFIGNIFSPYLISYIKNNDIHNHIYNNIVKPANERYIARLEKNFKKSDELRNKIIDEGYIVNDLPDNKVNIIDKRLVS